MNRKTYLTLFLLIFTVSCSHLPDERSVNDETARRTEQSVRETAALQGSQTAEVRAVTETASVFTATPLPPTLTPTITPTPEPSRYEVPVLSQDGLTLNGARTGVGCVPVCIQMMTSYWNERAGLPVLDAQELIDELGALGKYVAGRGMSSAAAKEQLNDAGYTHRLKSNGSKEELLAAFERYGPVGVLVKTRWVPDSMNHSVVMTEWDPNTEQITLNDPYYGSAVTWDWEAFDGIWGLNYAAGSDDEGKEVRRIYYIIYPADGELMN